MFLLRPDLVVVFLPLNVHKIQLINHPHALEQIDGPVNGGPVDIRIALAGLLQQSGSIQMTGGVLDGLNERAPLRSQADSPALNCIEQVIAFQLRFIRI